MIYQLNDIVQQNDGTTYVPFSDGITLQSQGYEIVNQNDFNSDNTYTDYYDSFFNGDTQKNHKCEYCGKPDYHANCHAHKKWCPLYCGGDTPPSLPIGDELIPFLIILGIYSIFKLKK
jgi:hypothetical protein